MPDLAPEVPQPATAPAGALAQSVAAMVADPDYPCLGARSVYRRDRATVRVYDRLAGPDTGGRLLADLRSFAAALDVGAGFASFVAIFRGPRTVDEQQFEELLWGQLRALHEQDETPWNAGVAADPGDEHFAFSVGGTAYFVVGLHPAASRDARRAATPTLVFNVHEQFEALRRSGGYPRMRDRIRERDARLQGTINPMVADHGAASEARQYSGRAVGPSWRPPFDPAKEKA